MNKSAKFWNRMASRYSEQAVADEQSYQQKLRVTQQHLKPNMEVLELGCGTGSTAIEHASFVNNILAVDSSVKMIEIARQKTTKKRIENVLFKTQSIEACLEDTETAGKSFDCVMAHSLLHLVEDKTQIIKGAHKILKSDGIFVTSTPCLSNSIAIKVFSPLLKIGAYFSLLPQVSSRP